jgi:TRAP-type C4-dicarboxylate transport system permease small subunit
MVEEGGRYGPGRSFVVQEVMTVITETLLERQSERTGAFARLTRQLDSLYLAAGYFAGACMVAVFAITMAQVACRWFGIQLNGATAYAGYFMAASTFFAFAHTFNHGAHVRIELFLSLVGRGRKIGEWFAFFVSALVTVWFAYYAWDMVYWSYMLGDLSQELDATPLWIPQLAMALGLSLFALAVVDHGLRLVMTGHHEIPESPDAL